MASDSAQREEIQRLRSLLAGAGIDPDRDAASDGAPSADGHGASGPGRGADRLRVVFEAMPVGILISDDLGRIVEGNIRVDEILKHPAARPDGEAGARWVAAHGDGKLVGREEFPLRRVLDGGETHAVLEANYHKGDGTRGWVRFEAVAMPDDAGGTSGAIVAITDIDDRKKAEAQQRFLMTELSHRVKNILAVVASITRQTLRGAHDLEEASDALLSRINALAGAHGVLMQHHWASADLRTLVAGALQLQDATGEQVVVAGPDLRLGPQAALSIALVLHELGTNAVKYGALSEPAGRVEVGWTREEGDEPRLRLQWRESDGPAVEAPRAVGFGSRLIKHSLASFGTVTMDYAASGFVLVFTAPLMGLQRSDPS